MEDLRKLFGARVREQRKAQGFSQEGFAYHCGLDRSYMGGVERGERNVALLNIAKIAQALKISVSELMNFEGVEVPVVESADHAERISYTITIDLGLEEKVFPIFEPSLEEAVIKDSSISDGYTIVIDIEDDRVTSERIAQTKREFGNLIKDKTKLGRYIVRFDVKGDEKITPLTNADKLFESLTGEEASTSFSTINFDWKSLLKHGIPFGIPAGVKVDDYFDCIYKSLKTQKKAEAKIQTRRIS